MWKTHYLLIIRTFDFLDITWIKGKNNFCISLHSKVSQNFKKIKTKGLCLNKKLEKSPYYEVIS